MGSRDEWPMDISHLTKLSSLGFVLSLESHLGFEGRFGLITSEKTKMNDR